MKKILFLILPFIVLSACSVNKTETNVSKETDVKQTINESENQKTKEKSKPPAPLTKDVTQKQESNVIAGQKSNYLKKLDDIEKGLKDLESLYQSGVTADMMKAEDETLKRWDGALNEIYNVLKSELSAGDMQKLKNEEIAWINHRNKVAEEESSAFKGGTMEPVQYLDTTVRLTKERCYELLNKYMK